MQILCHEKSFRSIKSRLTSDGNLILCWTFAVKCESKKSFTFSSEDCRNSTRFCDGRSALNLHRFEIIINITWNFRLSAASSSRKLLEVYESNLTRDVNWHWASFLLLHLIIEAYSENFPFSKREDFLMQMRKADTNINKMKLDSLRCEKKLAKMTSGRKESVFLFPFARVLMSFVI